MKIAMLGMLIHSISSDSAGGTEVFTSSLTDGLVEKGVDVTLFASSDSVTNAKLISVCSSKQASTYEGIVPGYVPYELLQAKQLIERSQEFDVIHNNSWAFYFFSSFSSLTNRPVITTIHYNFWYYPNLKEALIKTHVKGKDIVVFASKAAQKLVGNLVDSQVIPHGINILNFPFSPNSEDYVLWFSRFVPSKGIKPAVDAARLGQFRLITAGSPAFKAENRAYIEEHITPFLTNNISYIGEPNKEQKISLYQNAKAFLFPTLTDEQFGLVLIEAMSCGTPVIAYNRGAISEVVEDGVTGFIIDPDDEPRPGRGSWVIKKQGVEGLVEAVKRIGEIDRAACRARVEKYFTKDLMISRYIDLYERISLI